MAIRSPGNILELCSGVGGFSIGLERLGGRTVCHVERDAYAASVLVARMESAALAPAPIWDDLSTFDGKPWRGVVDTIAAGFPCQPFSAAGEQRGIDDDRWLWPAIADIVRDVRPLYVFLENVPGIVRLGLSDILSDLAAIGFDAEWDLFRASDVGAPHKRERFFLLADAMRSGGSEVSRSSHGDEEAHGSQDDYIVDCSGKDVADTASIRHERGRRTWVGGVGSPHGYPPPPDDIEAWNRLSPEAQPAFCSCADGLPAGVDRHRADQLRCLGNAVMPDVVALAWKVLVNAVDK